MGAVPREGFNRQGHLDRCKGCVSDWVLGCGRATKGREETGGRLCGRVGGTRATFRGVSGCSRAAQAPANTSSAPPFAASADPSADCVPTDTTDPRSGAAAARGAGRSQKEAARCGWRRRRREIAATWAEERAGAGGAGGGAPSACGEGCLEGGARQMMREGAFAELCWVGGWVVPPAPAFSRPRRPRRAPTRPSPRRLRLRLRRQQRRCCRQRRRTGGPRARAPRGWTGRSRTPESRPGRRRRRRAGRRSG